VLQKDVALRLLDEAARFGTAILEGESDADRGEFIVEEEMNARLPQAASHRHCNQERMSKEYVEQRDGNCYVTGTRVSLDSLIHAFHRGESPETICQNFELLNLEEIYGAIAYYLANQVALDAYLISQGEKWEEGRRTQEPLPSGLRQRLMRERGEMQAPRPL